ncbi:MAG: ABC transporter substrate-binding protein [Burkholderiales bacterium]|nr:ABC transporter substrate-binding protein [Burkholderiales bacterium]
MTRKNATTPFGGSIAIGSAHARWPVTLLLATAMMFGSASANAAPPKDTFVVAGNLSSMITLDPAAIAESITAYTMRSVCDALIELDDDDASKLVPGIAESWSVAPDGSTFTFKIRKGVKFPSGNPVTAVDVLWSMKRTLTLNLANAQRLREWDINVRNVDDVIRVSDPFTLVIQPTRPIAPGLFPFALTDFRNTAVLDRVTIQKHEVAGDMGHKWLATHSACVGPFRVTQWRPQEILVLERNDEYFGRKPSIRRMIIRHTPEAGAQRLMLEKGDIDMAMDIDPADFAALEKNPNVRMMYTPSLRINYFMFNMKDPRFRSPKLFEAFRYLIDYEGLEKTLLKNEARVRQSPVPSGVFGALPDEYKPFKLDIAKAKALLAEAGYPNGFSAELIVLNGFPSVDIAQHLQANADKVGVKLKITQMVGAQLFKRARARNFEIYMAGYGFNYPDANNVMLRHAYNPDNSDGAKNSLSVAWRASWDPGQWINDTIRAAQVERDQAKRLAMYQEIQRRHMASSPLIYLFQNQSVTVLHKRVKTFKRNLIAVNFAAVEKE